MLKILCSLLLNDPLHHTLELACSCYESRDDHDERVCHAYQQFLFHHLHSFGGGDDDVHRCLRDGDDGHLKSDLRVLYQQIKLGNILRKRANKAEEIRVREMLLQLPQCYHLKLEVFLTNEV